MKYYKLLSDMKMIGVGTSLDMRRFQNKHNIILACNEDKAQYMQCGETLYHANWMLPAHKGNAQYVLADIIEIGKEEYDKLNIAVANNDEIVIEEEDSEPINTDVYGFATIEYAKSQKINEMWRTGRNVVANGVDVKLSDKKSHHFSFGRKEQSDMASLLAMVYCGESKIPYRATGESFKYYTPDDFMKIALACNKHKVRHTVYLDSLIDYIDTLQDINVISAIEYGCPVPKEFQSDVLKDLTKEN